MEQPPGFVAQGEIGKVCRLRKSLYGLKQGPRAWFGKFSQKMRNMACKRVNLMVVHVDDIVITGSNSKGISFLKSFLHSQFHTKDLGMLRHFLGIEVMRSKHRIFLSQRKYMFDLSSDTKKLGVKPCNSTMAPGIHLTREGETFENPEKYRRLVGKLNYFTVTRPDIAYSVSVVSQYMSSPTVDHWAVVEKILCYLKGASRRGILYNNHGHNRLERFTNAD